MQKSVSFFLLSFIVYASAIHWLEADLPDDVVLDGCIAYDACVPWANLRTRQCGKALYNYHVAFDAAYSDVADKVNRPLTYGLLQAITAVALHHRGTCARALRIGFKPLSVPDSMAPDEVWTEAMNKPLDCVVNSTHAPICETYEMLIFNGVNPASKLQEFYRRCIPEALQILEKDTVHDMLEIAHCNDDFMLPAEQILLLRDDIGTRATLLNLYVDLLNQESKK